MRFLGLLVFAVSLLATSATTELRRETSVELEDCDRSQFSDRYPSTVRYTQQLMQHIMENNSDVFHGDLAPENFCIGITDNRVGGRAWADSKTRTMVIDPNLVLRVQNDAQLAWIVAHELAHVSMRHYVEPNSSRHNAARVEAEADVIGAHLYLRAGFTSDELAWRVQQLAVLPDMMASVTEPDYYGEVRTTTAGHSRSPDIPASQRIANAYQTCGGSSAQMSEPNFGSNMPYPAPCWSVWSVRHGEPARSAEFRRLMNDSRSLVNVITSPNLSAVKTEILTAEPPPDPKMTALGETLTPNSEAPTAAPPKPARKTSATPVHDHDHSDTHDNSHEQTAEEDLED
ncbi:M48 family metalloprotease [Pseudobdellovibrio exovorus]|uniref:Peptidase M48 domain-containing protein n=1 Tax=Pseudobdellovibrio exovorus JSS TaxID=1184267 RepID=M4V960_9BACT|nr:M48 family metalloprotease [Pseudobdellovibrio exovorus]AGH94546.1 hypothetical protein A11Q_326 [Pseudobdellovibrio exovorus JSS]